MENGTRESGIVEKGTRDFYWGILPREEMRSFVQSAREKGFAAASRDFPFSVRFDYAEEYSRADFHFLLPLPAEADILDLGSGFGNITIPLSYHYGTVTAADASRELLELIEIRARELGRDNISFVRVDPLGSGSLPFADSSFDAVMLNGVWEWVGLSDTTRSVPEIQQVVLAEIYRVLRPGGMVYMGIENRWFPGWLGRDPHSKLRYTAALPRLIANWYAKRHGLSEGYRTYIYGFRAYRRKFISAGFKLENTFLPYTSYRDLQYVYPLNAHILKFLFARGFGRRIYTSRWYMLLQMLRIFGMTHTYLSSFMFVLRKPPFGGSVPVAASHVLASNPEWKDSDIVMKIKSDDPDRVSLLAFRKGEADPYGTYAIPRIPKQGASVSYSPFTT